MRFLRHTVRVISIKKKLHLEGKETQRQEFLPKMVSTTRLGLWSY